MATDKQHAHQLLDQLGPGQIAAVVHLLEVMVELIPPRGMHIFHVMQARQKHLDRMGKDPR